MLTFTDIKERGDILQSLDISETTADAAAALILGYDGARPLVLLAVDRNGLMMPTLYQTPTLEEGSQLQLVCRALCRSRFPLLRCLVPTGDTQTYNLLSSSGWSYDGIWKGLSRTPDGTRQDGYIFTFEEVGDDGRQHIQQHVRQSRDQDQAENQIRHTTESVYPSASDPNSSVRADALEPDAGPDVRGLAPERPDGDTVERTPAGGRRFTWHFGHSSGGESHPD